MACGFCQTTLRKAVHIKCAECQNLELCLNCFSRGAEVRFAGHFNTHRYTIVDAAESTCDVPIFAPSWKANEELLLLEGIQVNGFANWSDTAEYVGTKSAEECEKHYLEVYLSGPEPHAPMSRLNEKHPSAPKKRKVRSSTASVNRAKGKVKLKAESKGIGAAAGYDVLRGDYYTEYENADETIFALMEFEEGDTDIQRQLKIKILDVYNSILDARHERKKLIAERRLLHPKKLSRGEKQLHNQLAVFTRFQSQQESISLFENLKLELKIRNEIKKFQEYRENGVRTAEEGDRFDKLTEKRTQKPKRQQRESKYAYRSSTRSRSTFSEKFPSVSKKRRRSRGGQNVLTQPGSELLSGAEKKLCCSLDLKPHEYTALKHNVLMESYANGCVSRLFINNLVEGDQEKCVRLFDHFVSAGWINPNPEVDSTHNGSSTMPFSFQDDTDAQLATSFSMLS